MGILGWRQRNPAVTGGVKYTEGFEADVMIASGALSIMSSGPGRLPDTADKLNLRRKRCLRLYRHSQAKDNLDNNCVPARGTSHCLTTQGPAEDQRYRSLKCRHWLYQPAGHVAATEANQAL